MCTAITYKSKNFYFGRNLDYDFSYGESVVITPRNYTFVMKHTDDIQSHYAIIGMALVTQNYPLYFDAMNEKGLCMAGLNFVNNACYESKEVTNKVNVASFEFIPYILSLCSTINEVKDTLSKMVLRDTPFAEGMQPGELHWLIADKDNNCITVEYMKDGMHVYDNPTGVLTNNPPFPLQLFNLNNYQGLSNAQPVNTFAKYIPLECYSRGMGGLGLPGDLSSMSRFVKAAFTRSFAKSNEDEASSVSQFFHLLTSVEQQRGCCDVGEGKYEITLYSSCCSVNTGIYYYTTYDRHQITAVNINHADLDSNKLITYPLLVKDTICYQN